MRGRSTPGEFADFAVITDARGREWKYSAPADVWRVVTGETGPGSVSATSARSWHRLLHEFGPLTADPRRVDGDHGHGQGWLHHEPG